jgi:hypothetical protein
VKIKIKGLLNVVKPAKHLTVIHYNNLFYAFCCFLYSIEAGFVSSPEEQDNLDQRKSFQLLIGRGENEHKKTSPT